MRGLVRLIVVLVIIVGGYWAYYAFAAANPNDGLGVEINKRFPTAARQFACEKLKERFGDINPPEGCADFAFWAPAAPATPAPSTTGTSSP